MWGGGGTVHDTGEFEAPVYGLAPDKPIATDLLVPTTVEVSGLLIPSLSKRRTRSLMIQVVS